ncbi:hypothetical protein GALMADRAFT_238952 [Galerina marginata CBS 339.88]|uniref:BTB domain-containing protein n=1 Tax=Galerina marginata (strain CBS 339.88) TaxID=685588 RepID=A0A067TLA1_GALM3|nr:hypothetical protein GALMADRAFT_238952 [Galerina marginata CBS 339.88]
MSAAAVDHNPRKRARSPQPDTQTLPVNDSLYYMDEGDCFIRVEDTIFKIPRYFLTKGSSVFRDMFSLPQEGASDAQSLSKDDPLVLQDTVADFRALCWLFNAPPQEIVDQEDAARIDIRKMVSILFISNKYQFLEYEKWVIALLERHCNRESENGTFQNTKRCSILEYKRLLTLTCLKGNTKIRTHICDGWIDRLKKNVSLSSKDALDFATSLGLRNFQGRIYYNEIQRMKTDPLAGSTSLRPHENDWSIPQILCLYRGYHSLSVFWNHLLSGPRPAPDTSLDHIFGTPNTHGNNCAFYLQKCWKSTPQPSTPGQPAYGNPQILNPLESLDALSKALQGSPTTCRCKTSTFAEQVHQTLPVLGAGKNKWETSIQISAQLISPRQVIFSLRVHSLL